jgi:hypothetical protein
MGHCLCEPVLTFDELQPEGIPDKESSGWLCCNRQWLQEVAVLEEDPATGTQRPLKSYPIRVPPSHPNIERMMLQRLKSNIHLTTRNWAEASNMNAARKAISEHPPSFYGAAAPPRKPLHVFSSILSTIADYMCHLMHMHAKSDWFDGDILTHIAPLCNRSVGVGTCNHCIPISASQYRLQHAHGTVQVCQYTTGVQLSYTAKRIRLSEK